MKYTIITAALIFSATTAIGGNLDSNPYERDPVGHSGNPDPFVSNPDCPWKHISQDCDKESKPSPQPDPKPEVVCRNNIGC